MVVKAMGDVVKVGLGQATDEALCLHLRGDGLLLVPELSKSIDDQPWKRDTGRRLESEYGMENGNEHGNNSVAPPTLDDGQQNDNDKEEEGDVKEEPQKLIWVSSG